MPRWGTLSLSFEELQGAVDEVAGVAASRVEDGTAQPVVRVWLDGTRDPLDVAGEVDRTLREAGFSTRESILRTAPKQGEAAPMKPQPGAAPARRTGLGRGLDALILPTNDETTFAVSRGIVSVAVIQSIEGVMIRVTDTAGRTAEAAVGATRGKFMDATVDAVAALLGVDPSPSLAAAEERMLGGATVVTVSLERANNGGHLAGSAVMVSGELLAHAQAIWSALRPVS